MRPGVAVEDDGLWPGRFALEEKGGTVGYLRSGSIDAKVPNRCRDEVLAGMEERREVEALVAPVSQIAAGRAVSYAMTVDEEDEAIVGADANYVAGGNAWEIQDMTEVKHDGFAQWGDGVRDPRSVPRATGRIRRSGGLGRQNERTKAEEDQATCTAHRNGPFGVLLC